MPCVPFIAFGGGAADRVGVCRRLGARLAPLPRLRRCPGPVLGRRPGAQAGSAPRAVPLDAVTALLDPRGSSGLQQQLAHARGLPCCLRGAASLWCCGGTDVRDGRGRRVRRVEPVRGRAALVGQPPTLPAYSMTPWIGRPWPRLRDCAATPAPPLAAALPAALTPGGVTAAAVALGHLALAPQSAVTALARRGGCGLLAWCLPMGPSPRSGGRESSPTLMAPRPSPACRRRGRDRRAVADAGRHLGAGARPASRNGLAAAGRLDPARACCSYGPQPVLATGTAGRSAAGGGLPGAGRSGARGWRRGPGLRCSRRCRPSRRRPRARHAHRLLGFAALAVAVAVGLAAEHAGRWLRGLGRRHRPGRVGAGHRQQRRAGEPWWC